MLNADGIFKDQAVRQAYMDIAKRKIIFRPSGLTCESVEDSQITRESSTMP